MTLAKVSLYLTLASRDYPNEHVFNNNEPQHQVSNNVVCATSKASDQPAHTRNLI